jgi:hypothetical protein
MKLMRICLVSLGSVAGAFAFGVVANATLDLVMPAGAKQAQPVASVPASVTVTEEPAPTFALASATTTPVDLGPVRVKTLPIIVRDGQFIEQADEGPAAPALARVPLPRPRPAGAPAQDTTASVARQPGSLAIAAATRKASPEDGEMLSAAGIDRLKMALALTAEQEEYWPAIAAELHALGKVLKATKAQPGNITLDGERMQRLYYAAAPLISRLSYEQKLKVKQMAHVMGLHQVAEAL